MRNFKKEFEGFRKDHKELHKEIDGADFRYWLSGNGDLTYVLLPGGMGSGEFFFLHILALEKNNKVLTFDYPKEFSDNNSMADGIINFIDSLGLKNIILVGQSYGGMISQVIAKRHPDKLAGMVLSNTGTATENVIPSDKKLANMIKGQKAGLGMMKILPYSWIKKIVNFKMQRHMPTIPETHQQYLKDIFSAMLEVYTYERCKLMTTLLFDFHTKQTFTKKDFDGLKTKQLLIFSPDDKTFSEDVRSELASLMPNAEIERGISGGHLALVIEIDKFINRIVGYQWQLEVLKKTYNKNSA